MARNDAAIARMKEELRLDAERKAAGQLTPIEQDFQDLLEYQSEQPTPTTALAIQYADLYAKRVAAEKALTEIKDKMTRMEMILLERFVQEGVQSIRTIGGNVYLHHQVWASAVDAGLLAASDWAWMVKDSVNSNTLSAAVRELDIDGEGRPIFPQGVPEVAVKITDKYSVRVRQS